MLIHSKLKISSMYKYQYCHYFSKIPIYIILPIKINGIILYNFKQIENRLLLLCLWSAQCLMWISMERVKKWSKEKNEAYERFVTIYSCFQSPSSMQFEKVTWKAGNRSTILSCSPGENSTQNGSIVCYWRNQWMRNNEFGPFQSHMPLPQTPSFKRHASESQVLTLSGKRTRYWQERMHSGPNTQISGIY
jgi:hypothetical protein